MPWKDNAYVDYVYHPDGRSYRGRCIGGNIHSVCNHAHRTISGALRCAKSKRASFKRGEWAPIGSTA